MKKFRTFNPVEFNSYVKFVKDNVKHVISNSKAKYVICQAGKDNNYNVDDVYGYLHETMMETYPEYMLKLNNRDWRKIYENYMDDEDLAPKLSEILDFKGGKKDNGFYRDSFFEVMKEMGVNPETMKIDMCIDLFGWIWIFETIVKRAEENPYTGEFPFEIKCEKETSKRERKTSSKKSKKSKTVKKTKTVKGSKKSSDKKTETLKEKLMKTSGKVKEVFVVYYLNKDKTFDRTREIGRFGSHKDTCTTLGINKGVLSNYLKGRKDSIFWNNEDGQKVRIGVEKLAA